VKVIQIASTAGDACGVGNFALNLQNALQAVGVEVRTVREFPSKAAAADCILVQYGWNMFDDKTVADFCARSSLPVFMFAHHHGVEQFEPAVRGFLTVARGIISPTSAPVLDLKHPGWAPEALSDRILLKRRFGLPDSPVVGSSGFLMLSKEYPEVLRRLLPFAREEGFFVELATSRWFKGSDEVLAELAELRDVFPESFRFGDDYLDQAELNLRLQACDLLWCWTRTKSSPYGSGSISDQYGSGSRIVAPDKLQFRHVLELANTVTCEADIDDLVASIVRQVRLGRFERHDPHSVSWDEAAKAIEDFVAGALTA